MVHGSWDLGVHRVGYSTELPGQLPSLPGVHCSNPIG